MISEAVGPPSNKQERMLPNLPQSQLAAALHQLDKRIERALQMLPSIYGSASIHDPFRGLHINPDDVATLLSHAPGAPLFNQGDEIFDHTGSENLNEDSSRLGWLARAFNLSTFDLDVVLIVLAPEIDLRYERLYAYLQDDVTRRRPSVDLALNLLCTTFEDKLAHRAHFTGQAPLLKQGILHLVHDQSHSEASLLAQYLKLDGLIVQFLLGDPGLDHRLHDFCELFQPSTSLQKLPYPEDFKRAILALLAQSLESGYPLHLFFQGPAGSGRRRLAEALAWETKRPLLLADLRRTSLALPGVETTLRLLFRQAWFLDAILYLEGLDEMFQADQDVLLDRFLKLLASEGWITVLAGEQPWRAMNEPVHVIRVPLNLPGIDERLAWWSASLSRKNIIPDSSNLVTLSSQFRLLPGQIEAAVGEAIDKARWRQAIDLDNTNGSINPSPSLAELYTAARAQTGHPLAHLAQKIQAHYAWEDIILPEDSLTQLRELCQWVVHHNAVLDEWGFERRLSLGKGVTALFAGPSGTGKTMAAEIIANELGLDLYRIDLSTVVSKYIGETEKNLERIFTAAENANAILFFDEADALFGKRSEVRDSHDRYANIEISYLLQKMEQYDGIAILASNLRQNLDEAFTRRLAFIIPFPFPDEDHRRRIWQGIFPPETPLGEDLDLPLMARQFRLSGGNIKNIALSAAFLAASDGGVVRMEHLFHATQREFQKLGKTLTEEELYGSYKSRVP